MMPIQKIKENLKKKLSSKRYEHTIGVEYTSTCLAMRYGVDIFIPIIDYLADNIAAVLKASVQMLG